MKVIKHQLGFLLYGFIFWLPIAIVVLVGVYIFGHLEDFGHTFLTFFIPDRFVLFFHKREAHQPLFLTNQQISALLGHTASDCVIMLT